jgi:threonyl-tRNA synthetase
MTRKNWAEICQRTRTLAGNGRMVRKVLIETGVPFVEVKDEGAFYGPKIDVQIWSAIGREFTLATNQVDFAQPRSFQIVIHQ